MSMFIIPGPTRKGGEKSSFSLILAGFILTHKVLFVNVSLLE